MLNKNFTENSSKYVPKIYYNRFIELFVKFILQNILAWINISVYNTNKYFSILNNTLDSSI